MSSIILASVQRKTNQPLRVLDLLSASGVRGLRIKAEVPNVDVTINDYKEKAYALMKKNAKLNKLDVTIKNKPANVLLTELNTYDYIDLDPFGTPVPFLDSAIKRLSLHSILAVTATDTSALCGAYPNACLRKYGSKPLRNEFMHETAIRILIKKCQEVAAQYDVSLIPIFSHSSNHYVRVYLQKTSSAKKADAVLKQHGLILYCPDCCWRGTTTTPLVEKDSCPKCKAKLEWAGPIWLGELWDQKLVKRMRTLALWADNNLDEKAILNIEKLGLDIKQTKKFKLSKATIKLISQIHKEMSIKTVGFYDLHVLAKKNKWKEVPRMDCYLSKTCTKTHFRLTGLRTKSLHPKTSTI